MADAEVLFPCAFCDFETPEHERLVGHLRKSHQKRQPEVAMVPSFALPIQGLPEREHLYEWMANEEWYVSAKFDDQRQGHDESLEESGLADWWERQIFQYFDRAKLYLRQAEMADDESDVHRLHQRAQQAMAKAMMTAKGCVEASIRVYGPLPAPAVNSGVVLHWPNRGGTNA